MIWTSIDTRNAVISSLLPGAVAAIGFTQVDQADTIWYNALRKPNYAVKDMSCCAVGDVLALSPLGYASYLVYKQAGGLDTTDAKIGLGLYAASLLLALSKIPAIKSRDLSSLWKNTTLVHLTGAGAAYYFYKIHNNAGLLLLPYVLWSGYHALAFFAMSPDSETHPKKAF
ncbi:unnamed protein product [Caenorhabditis auriculariae]|uniref:Uncharacterized protein n=1 Tax=Caenorhabditis auriculariae TaxID=2777116 RepID=A0A8S1HF81_9PELO|nr:unnamed protein product [Caenorhabditis auriculariae]